MHSLGSDLPTVIIGSGPLKMSLKLKLENWV
jgi:hypothetical protein